MRTRLFVIFASLWLWVSAAWAILDPPQILKVGSYTFEISQFLVWDSKDEQGRPVEGLRIYLTVKRGDSEVIFREEGNFYSYGDPNDPKNVSLVNGTDLTGDGEPDVVVAEKMYDPEVTWKFWVFSVGEKFKLLGKIRTVQEGIPTFRGKDGKLKFPEKWEKTDDVHSKNVLGL